MESEQPILAFALAQPTRLDVFRPLMEQEPDGLAVGDVARHVALPHYMISTHLATPSPTGMIEAEQQSQIAMATSTKSR